MPQSTVSNGHTTFRLFAQIGADPESSQAATFGESPCPSDGAGDGLARLVREFAFLVPAATMPCLEASSKEDAITTLVARLAAAGAIPVSQQEHVTQAVLRREELATTGIGQGVAIPHTKHPAVERLVGALAYSPQGIDFASLDGRPVHLVFLLVSPPGEARQHLMALEAVSRSLIQQGYDQWRNPCRHAED